MPIQREIIFKADDSQFSSIVDRIGKNISNAFNQATGSIQNTNSRLSDFAGSVNSEMEKIKKSGTDAFNSLLQSSEKYTNSSKERLQFLSREIALQERLVREERERERMAAKMSYESKRQTLMDRGGGVTQMRQLDDQYDEEKTQLDANDKVRQAKMRSLRNEYEAYRNNEIAEGETKSSGKGGNYLNRAGGAAKNTFSAALGAAGFGAALTIAGFVGKAVAEGEELARASTSFSGLSTRGTAGVGSMYDLKTADALRYSEEVAKASGSINGIAGRSRNQYSFEKAFSLEAGELNNMSTALRVSGGRSSSSVALEMLNYFKQSKLFGIDKGDFTKMSELLTINNELNTQQVDQLDRIDPTQSTNLMKMFGKLGIDSTRLTSYTGGINQGITDPKDEFSQAIIYRALRKANPNMSLFELQEKQEQGIFGKGNLSAVMGEMSRTSSGEMLMKNVATAFGLKNFQARNIVEAYEKDGSIFDGEGGINKARALTTADVAGRASNNTTVLQTLLVRFNDKFASWGKEMLDKLGEYVDEFDREGWDGLLKKMADDIIKAISSGFQKVLDKVTGKDHVDLEAERKMRSQGVDPGTGITGDFFNWAQGKLTPDLLRKRYNARLSTFNDNLGEQDRSLRDGIWLPGGKMTHVASPFNLFNDQTEYAYSDYDHLKNMDKGTKYRIKGKEDELEPLLRNMTRGEHKKVFEMGRDDFNKLDALDGIKDNTITVQVLKAILGEIRKGNAPTAANVLKKSKK